MIGCLRERRYTEDLLRRSRMDVFAATKGFDQHGIFGEMGQDSKLDLRVVRGKEFVAWSGDEGCADFAAQFGADRNILQVRIRRTETPGSGAGLREARVQAAGNRMNQFGQRV